VIHIDRLNTDVEVAAGPATEGAGAPAAQSVAASGFGPVSEQRLRDLVLDVLRDHLRDLERQGLL